MNAVRRVALLGALALSVALPAAAEARVSLLHAVSGAPGDSVSLSVTVSPAATCRISVTYKSGVSHAQGLSPKRGSRITWTWRVGRNTTPGSWPVVVDCGKAGKLTTRLRVR